jgi:HK97 family phage major capsid protein
VEGFLTLPERFFQMSDTSDTSDTYRAVVERLDVKHAEWVALFRAFGPRVNGPSYGHLMSERDTSRGRFLRDEIVKLRGFKRELEERSGQTRDEDSDRDVVRGATVGSDRGSSHDYDRDPVREPESVEDGRDGHFRDPWDLRGIRVYSREPARVAAELHARALAAIEKMPACSDAIRATATRIFEGCDDRDSRLAKHILLTSRPAYLRAWAKLMNNKPHLTPEERHAFTEVQEHRAATRALTTTDIQSGYLLPFQLDSTLIVQSAFVRSDLRQAANVVIAISDVWNGISSQNIQYTYQQEGAEALDNSPSFGQPSIPTYMARGFIPVSIELLGDAANATQQVAKLLAGGKSDLEGVKHILGTGIGEPTGLVTALSASSNSGSVVTTAAAGTLTLADLYSVDAALPAHYRASASWISNKLVYNKIRAFDTAGSSAFWTNLTTDRPPQLLNRDALEAEAISGIVASGNKILVYGNLEAAYTIVDHVGGQITELIPMLFNTSHSRPSGQRGWFSYFRQGSDLVNSQAVRCLAIQ